MNDYFDKHPVVGDDGTIYAVSYRQQLYAITAEGRKRWFKNGQPTSVAKFWDEIQLTPEGVLITTAGRITVPSGLAKGGWPTQNGDNSNRRSQERP